MHHNLSTNMYIQNLHVEHSYLCMYVMLVHVSRPNSGTCKIIYFWKQITDLSTRYWIQVWSMLHASHCHSNLYPGKYWGVPNGITISYTGPSRACAVPILIIAVPDDSLQNWIVHRYGTATTIPLPACPLMGHKKKSIPVTLLDVYMLT